MIVKQSWCSFLLPEFANSGPVEGISDEGTLQLNFVELRQVIISPFSNVWPDLTQQYEHLLQFKFTSSRSDFSHLHCLVQLRTTCCIQRLLDYPIIFFLEFTLYDVRSVPSNQNAPFLPPIPPTPQLVDLLLQGDWSTFFADHGSTTSKYSRVSPQVVAKLLEK